MTLKTEQLWRKQIKLKSGYLKKKSVVLINFQQNSQRKKMRHK